MMPPNETHRTCAAKLAFTVPEAAANFKRKADSELGVWFHGKRLGLKYNRAENLRTVHHGVTRETMLMCRQACLGAIRTQGEIVGKVHADYGVDGRGNRAARALEQHGVRLY